MSPPSATVRTLRAENAELRARLAEAEATLRAIRAGDVDALVVEGDNGPQIFTLQGLDAEQNRFRGEMLAQVSDSVIAVDKEDHITFLNAAAERQYGLRADEVVGCKLASIITRHWPSPEAEAEMWTAMNERGEWRGELIHRTQDGRELHIETSVAALRGPDRERIGVVRTIRDVSERKRLEMEKAEALRLLDTLLTHAPVGFAFLDRDLRFVRINERLAEINGLTIAAHLGKTVAEILPTLEATLREVTGRILATGQPVLDHEFSGETASAPGITRYWNQSWYPVHDGRGQIMGFGGVVDEITERKRAEENLRLTTDRIELAVRASKARLWQQDLDLRYTWLYNPMPGFDALGKREADLLEHAEDVARIESLKREVIRSGVGLHKEFSPRIQGVVRCFDLLMEPLRDAAGNITGLTGAVIEITERKRAEQVLEQSRERILMASEAAQIGFWSWQPDEDSVVWENEYPYRIIGVPPGSPPVNAARFVSEFLHPDDAPLFEQAVARAVQVGEPFAFMGRIRRPDGEARWVEFTGKSDVAENGRAPRIIGTVQDITKRKLVEEELRESEVKLRDQLSRLALLEQITRGISLHLGFQRILKVVANTLEDALPVDFSCVCLIDEQAKECSVAQVGLKSAPLALKLALPERAVIPLDCVALTQVARGELSYLPDVREMKFPFPQRLAKGGLRSLVLAPLLLEGKAIGFLMVARREVRGFRESECEFLKQLSEHVALACQQAKLHDSLQMAYDALRRTQQAAMQRERLRALGQMASGITHDISNAISPVALYAASLLEHEPGLSVRARDYLQTIHQSVQSVAETISRMRDFYREDGPHVVLTPVGLNNLAQQALDLTRVHWRDGLHKRGFVIQTEARLAEDLPDIMGVEGEIRDAIVNLIFNAVDAMPEGGTLTLRTMTKPLARGTGETRDPQQAYLEFIDTGTVGTPDARTVCLELIDTGIGMDEDTRRRCLEPFFTTKGRRGTGLGLAMVYGMITRHRATIEIESAPGEGTTVRMFFHAAPVASKRVDQCLPAKPEPAIQRILFVDDDPGLIKSMRDTLEIDGHTVVTATGGQAAIQAFIRAQKRKEAFTVVITDLGMPHVDGRKVASAVKAASPSTPVIMLTGWGPRLEAEGDLPAGVDRLLSKPPRLRDLREALAACCPPGPSKPTKA